jgi:peptidoglycan/xylan/chitin deacetylase (PgdA/CDA1 family)
VSNLRWALDGQGFRFQAIGLFARAVVAITSRKWKLLGLACVLAAPALVREALDLPSRQLFGEAYHNVDTSVNVVALTFDDGPDPIYTERILEVLERNRIKATFFMLGAAIERQPQIAGTVYARGHELGNHSYSHPWLLFKSPAFVRSEIEKTDLLLRRVGMSEPIHFRSPFGAQLIVLPYILSQNKRKNILFDVDPRDWETQDPQLLAQRVLERTGPGSIILLHDGGGARSGTVEALEIIIRELAWRGFRFVKVSELLTYAGR